MPDARRLRDRALAGLILLGSLAYLWTTIYQGWIPHDEGMLGQAAERVLAGELPHVDFIDTYSGGLSAFHALVFRFAGSSSHALRTTLFVATALFVAVFFDLLRRRIGILPAAGLVALTLAWSLQNYFAPLPSWYNTFLAVTGIWALARAGEAVGQRAWIVLAGAASGLSIAVKIVGVYFLGAAALALAWRELDLASQRRERGRGSGLAVTLILGLALASVVGTLGVIGRPGPGELFCLVIPVLAVGGVLARRALEQQRRGVGPALYRLLAAWGWLGLGAGIPLLGLLAPYVWSGELGALWEGLFVRPRLRLEGATYPLPGLWGLLWAAPALVLLLPRVQARLRRVGLWVSVALVLAALGGPLMGTYAWFWQVFRPAAAVLVLAGAVRLLGAPEGGFHSYLALASLALTQLVQWPYASGVYFLYITPLVVLVAIEVYREGAGGRRIQVGLALAVLVFSLVWLNRSKLESMGVAWEPRWQESAWLGGRAGLRVPAVQAAGYERIVELVAREGGASEWILAGPDAPEVYFLTGERNPTPTLFDLFDPPEWSPERKLEVARERGVSVVVANLAPRHHEPWPAEVMGRLAREYPEAEQVGPMLVRWRSRPGTGIE